ncbi:MAG: hypothetical protein NVS1B2_27230 [Vulcanimicrobiaceae bacterium]
MKYVYVARAIALAACTLPVTAVAATAPAAHVRGTIAAVSSTSVTVETASGSIDVPVDAKTKIVGVVPATAAEITPGTFIGTANVPGPGSAKALEVVVFPKAMAGTGEGDYPWDLPAGGKASTMTNGTVGGRASTMTNGTVGAKRSMMTNATVKNVGAGASKTVTLAYKGGTKVVSIPTDAPIVRIVPGSKSLLAKGAHVVMFPGAANAAAPFVIVGERGVTPPM